MSMESGAPDAPGILPSRHRARLRSANDADARTTHRNPAGAGTIPPGIGLGTFAGRQAAARACPPDEFIADVHREVRRVERSNSALSLIVYRCADAVGQRSGTTERLLEHLHATKREVDILGLLDEHTVAILCLDTDAEGVAAFIRKIESRGTDVPAATSATYPSDLFTSLAATRAPATSLGPLLSSGSGMDVDPGYGLKRAVDVLGASIAIVALAPIWLAAAAAIALSSRGPIVYTQTRLGRNGEPFTIFKFRSMVNDNDDSTHREFVARLIAADTSSDHRHDAAGTPFKRAGDPRVTAVGRFIRKTSIDELPQFLNVLRGDMSLVGPRPPLAYEAAQYQAWHLRRILSMKPGITGLWQVEGRSRVSFNDMVRMDLRYLRSCSLALDLRILFKTVLVVLHCDGAV